MSEQRISTRARVLAIPAIGAAAVGVALFSRGSAQTTPDPMASPSPGASPMASPEAGMPNAAGGAPVTAQTVKAGDLFFDPKEFTIPANTDVTVTLTNEGALQHDFVIDELSVNSGLVDPGASVTFTINGAAGSYQYYCSVPGHREAGMVGTLTIQ